MNRATPAPQAHGAPGNPHPAGPLAYPAQPYHQQGAPMGSLGPNPGQMQQQGGMQGGIPTQLTGGGMPTQMTGGGVPNGANGTMGQMFFTGGPPGGPGGVGRGVPMGPGGPAGMQGIARGGVVINGQIPRYVTGQGGPPGRITNGMGMPAGMGMAPGGMTAPNGMTISGGPGGMVMQGGMAVGRGAPPGPGQPMMSGGMTPGMGGTLRRMTSAPNLHGPAPPGYAPSNAFPPQPPGSMQPGSMSIPTMQGQHLIMPSQPHPSQPGAGPGQPKPGQQMQTGVIQGMTFQQQLGGTGIPQQLGPGHMGQQPMQMQNPMTGTPMSMGSGMSMGLGPNPMSVNPMGTPMSSGMNSGTPIRNPSPGQPAGSGGGSAAGTPANAGTPGVNRGRATPVNSQPPYPANASTPPNRPGTASHPTPLFPTQTPRMRAAEPMYQNPQTSPRQPSRQPSTTNLSSQPGPSGSMLPPGSLPQGGQMQAPGSTMPPSSASTPGPSGGANNVIRSTPAQNVAAMSAIFASGGGNLPPGFSIPGGPSYGPPGQPRSGPPMGRALPMGGPQQLQQPPPGGPGPLQPQYTGGGPQPPGAPLQPQHTGGSIHDQPMQPQHTGPSVQGESGGPPPQSGPVSGRGSGPGTPNTGRAVTGPGGPMGTPRIANSYPAHMMGHMAPPPAPRVMDGMMRMPHEVADMTMSGMGIGPHPAETGRRHNFGILRLLQFSDELRRLQDRGEEYWSNLLNKHFTDDATLKFRAYKGRGSLATGFVTLQGNLMTRFFDTFTQSNVFNMGFILDGARESEDRHEYSISCYNARWSMHYDNGWITELLGSLTAKCKTVPLKLSDMPNPSDPFLLPSDDQPSGSHSNSPMKLESSPPNPATSAGPSSDPSNSRIPMEVDSKPNPGSQSRPLPYIVKISELTFDSQSYMRYVDASKLKLSQSQDPTPRWELPPEPSNQFGVPDMTMRVVELSEGSYAMMPIFDQVEKAPLHAMFDYANPFNAPRGAFPMGIGPYGMPRAMMSIPPGLPEGDDAYSSLAMSTGFGMAPHGPGGVGVMPPSMGINPSSLSNGPSATNPTPGTSAGGAPAGSGNDTPGTSSAPSLSPQLSTKPAGKKGGGAPSSPTKTNADKGGKRKNTIDNDGPPQKRTRPTNKRQSKA